jgi:hypothetical protein
MTIIVLSGLLLALQEQRRHVSARSAR